MDLDDVRKQEKMLEVAAISLRSPRSRYSTWTSFRVQVLRTESGGEMGVSQPFSFLLGSSPNSSQWLVGIISPPVFLRESPPCNTSLTGADISSHRLASVRCESPREAARRMVAGEMGDKG